MECLWKVSTKHSLGCGRSLEGCRKFVWNLDDICRSIPISFGAVCASEFSEIHFGIAYIKCAVNKRGDIILFKIFAYIGETCYVLRLGNKAFP